MLSMIQIDRPCVPITRSSSLITRSRIDEAGMFIRSDCQLAPSSAENTTSRSVPANSSPGFFGSSRTTLTGPIGLMPETMRVQVRPRVVRPVDVRTHVVAADRVHRDVGGVGVEVAGVDLRDLVPRAQLRRRHVLPRLAAVARHVHEAIVGAGPDDVHVASATG